MFSLVPEIDLPAWLPGWQHIIPSVFIFIVGAIFVVFVQRVLGRALARASRHTPLSAETAMVIQRLVVSGMWLLLVLMTLRHMGVNIDGLWTLLP